MYDPPLKLGDADPPGLKITSTRISMNGCAEAPPANNANPTTPATPLCMLDPSPESPSVRDRRGRLNGLEDTRGSCVGADRESWHPARGAGVRRVYHPRKDG
ncbi:MAG: hypothetical protein DHS20C14_10270 [Phycisphaeraceae bacterium]|nr:MAG: hypothetical protein DHS20C14_10270 [Phycisphaeraceae bacterium]